MSHPINAWSVTIAICWNHVLDFPPFYIDWLIDVNLNSGNICICMMIDDSMMMVAINDCDDTGSNYDGSFKDDDDDCLYCIVYII